MLIGANQRTISCSVFVVREHIIPKMTRIATDKRQICKAVLVELQLQGTVRPE
jgi:hypothetical protein